MSAQYVAMGSSFAAGPGLGWRAPGSSYACLQSINGYPRQLARLSRLSLADMSCSGATTRHVLRGGQYFQRAQIDTIGPQTELVTLTIGGNDLGYVGDLTMISYRNRGGLIGAVAGIFWKNPQPAEKRDDTKLREELLAVLREITRRAPHAHLIVATYLTILPSTGTCSKLRMGEADVALMRSVGDRMAEVTRSAAQEAGANVVDMASLSAGHDACASAPWVNGAEPIDGAAFHPALAGSESDGPANMADYASLRLIT